jgi:glycine betaine/choline ABC-type transport system substrate-binding protein
VGLLVCATAAEHDLVVLHDDKDLATAARYIPDVRERIVHDAPQVS